MFSVKYTRSALEDLRALDARWRARILDEVDRHLPEHAMTESKARKLIDLAPPVELKEAVQPFWQLRVDHFRVFYNIDEEQREVRIWGIKAKPPEKSTSELLRGSDEDEDDESV